MYNHVSDTTKVKNNIYTMYNHASDTIKVKNIIYTNYNIFYREFSLIKDLIENKNFFINCNKINTDIYCSIENRAWFIEENIFIYNEKDYFFVVEINKSNNNFFFKNNNFISETYKLNFSNLEKNFSKMTGNILIKIKMNEKTYFTTYKENKQYNDIYYKERKKDELLSNIKFLDNIINKDLSDFKKENVTIFSLGYDIKLLKKTTCINEKKLLLVDFDCEKIILSISVFNKEYILENINFDEADSFLNTEMPYLPIVEKIVNINYKNKIVYAIYEETENDCGDSYGCCVFIPKIIKIFENLENAELHLNIFNEINERTDLKYYIKKEYVYF